MRAGILDRRLQILRAEQVDDGYQVRPGEYKPYGNPISASKTEISDGERYRADGVFQDMSARFQVRYSPFSNTIKHSDRLICEGRTYAIGGIKEIGRRVGFEITASQVQE
jgi:head-tail adaptor